MQVRLAQSPLCLPLQLFNFLDPAFQPDKYLILRKYPDRLDQRTNLVFVPLHNDSIGLFQSVCGQFHVAGQLCIFRLLSFQLDAFGLQFRLLGKDRLEPFTIVFTIAGGRSSESIVKLPCQSF